MRKSRNWNCELEWKPQALWIGAYWKRLGNCIDLWVCLLPCLPIHISWWWSREAEFERAEAAERRGRGAA